MERPYTVPLLAERWSCSKDFVYEQIRAGRLQSFRLGGKLIRILPEEVERWESIGENTPTDDTASGGSTAGRSRSGAMRKGSSTDTGLTPSQKQKADLRLMRSLENEQS